MKCWSQCSALSQFRIRGDSENFKQIVNNHGGNTEHCTRKLGQKKELYFMSFCSGGKMRSCLLKYFG